MAGETEGGGAPAAPPASAEATTVETPVTTEAPAAPAAVEPAKMKVGGKWQLVDKVMSIFGGAKAPAAEVPKVEETAAETPVVEEAPKVEEKAAETPVASPPAGATAADLAVLAVLAQSNADSKRRADEAEKALAEAREAAKPKAAAKRPAAQLIADLRREGWTTEDIAKAGLNLTAADVAEAESAHEVKALRAEVDGKISVLQQQQINFAVQQRQGVIGGMLESGDAYELARAGGWTAESVWAEQQKEFGKTGKLPTPKDTLDRIEADEAARLERQLATAKSKTKYTKVEAAKPAPAKPAAPARTITAAGGAAAPVKAKKMTWSEKLAHLQATKYPLTRKD